ncbi:hypothetical protein CRI93_00180 [Longimonas halophila]|uniref:Pentapeptide repeat-containing protein n=2 Tax=Longimonas halophila TaxID=1469170 RepID=A0A2H3P8H4_9BACT|nr:hypothetical protein CRI93_00180 [Longimonas halophila]
MALAYSDDPSQFDEDARLNTVYAHLLDGVYRRDYDFGPHPGADVLSGEDENEQKRGFLRVLEEIALDAWHGNGRTTTIPAIEKRCKEASLERHFSVVREKLEDGITQLLAAFYFRRSGETPKGVETFEFTHKTFAEYLTAKRIVRAIDEIHDRYQQHKDGGRYALNLRKCIVKWIEICGPADIGRDLYRFIQDEITILVETWETDADESSDASYSHAELSKRGVDAEAWQETFTDMLRHTIPHDVPMKEIDQDLDFQQQKNWAVNTERSILAMLDACRKALRHRDRQLRDFEPNGDAPTYIVSVFDEETRTAPFNWIRRLHALNPTSQHLSAISWMGCRLSTVTLIFADLRSADLRGVNLLRANLLSANLLGADLRDANLRGADLRSADLRDANLRGADLRRAELWRADLRNVELQDANLRNVELQDADLRDANLIGADLQDADLQDADLQDADLRGVNLLRANLLGADLLGAHLQGADLRDTDLQETNLRDTNLWSANLQGANLQGADLRGANLQGPDSHLADVLVANLQDITFNEETRLDSGIRETMIDQGAIFLDG